MELIYGAWISGPVHPSGHTFAKIAFNLLEAMAPSGKIAKSGGGSGRNESITRNRYRRQLQRQHPCEGPCPELVRSQQNKPAQCPAPVSPAASFQTPGRRLWLLPARYQPRQRTRVRRREEASGEINHLRLSSTRIKPDSTTKLFIIFVQYGTLFHVFLFCK
jgi:hypothetical protein